MPLDTDFAGHARPAAAGETELDLLVDGLDCPACVWLIESLLARNPAITRARAHLSTRRLSLRWRGAAGDANSHVGLVAALGFRPAPYDAVAAASDDDREARELLRCLAVAGFAAANVMLLSVAVWSGHDGSMGDATRTLFHWLSAAIALPAVAYAGRPFFRSAFAALRAGRTNMDVPISIGVTLACSRQPARGVGRRAARLLRLGDHAAVLPADRPLSRPPRARPRTPRRPRPAGTRQPQRHRGGGRRHRRLRPGRPAGAGQTRCWWAPASASAPTAS